MKNNLFVFTGPPCSWKTRLIDILQERWFSVLPEIQMQVIAEYTKKLWWEDAWKNWLKPDGIINKVNFRIFMEECIDIQIIEEKRIRQNKEPVVLDRSSLDGLSFLELRQVPDIEIIRSKVNTHIREIWWFAWVFSLSLLESEFMKRQQQWRVISLEEAQEFDMINRSVYRWIVDRAPIEFISRKDSERDARSISEAIHTIVIWESR